MKNRVPVEKITNVDELLAYNGGEFVDMAFRVLLRRNADPQGRAHYLERLQRGYGKDTVIHALYTSLEFRRTQQHSGIAGIEKMVGRLLWRKRTLGLSTWLRDLRNLERKLNQLEYALAERAMPSEQIIDHRTGAEGAGAANQAHAPALAQAGRVFEVRRGKSALLTLLNFESAVRASLVAKAFAR